MRNDIRRWFLLISVVLLLAVSVTACGPSGYTTYTNEQEGYSISYPMSWQVEVSKDGTTCIIVSPSRTASLMIYVTTSMSAQTAAQFWMMSLGTHWGQIAQLENKAMSDSWNWYTSYDYEADTGQFHGEAYFMSTADHTYRLDTAARKDEYSSYPFQYMISTFKLN